MKPLSDFTTPRKLIWPISRHFLPVEQPEPEDCCTTGLKNGSRFPLIAHFFSSGLGVLEASMLLTGSSPFAEILVSAAGAVVAARFEVVGLAAITESGAAVFLATAAGCGFAAAITGAGALLTPADCCTVAGGFAAAAPETGLAAGLADGVPVIPRAALESSVFFCCTVVMVLCTLLMTLGFCAQSPPVISPIAKMPVVSFIEIPICSRLPRRLRAWAPVPLRPDSNRD